MEQWHCFKCKEEMIEADIVATYLEFSNMVEGIQCPKCGVAYLTEETALGAVREAEEMLESK
jgi:predicted nucleic-acid-binding Zn-ribbon protein